jgi:hypothetical protein
MWDAMATGISIRIDRQKTVRALLVEDALFRKALQGDIRACIAFLKIYMPNVWGIENKGSYTPYNHGAAAEIEKLLGDDPCED